MGVPRTLRHDWQRWTAAALAVAVLAVTVSDLEQHYRGSAGAGLAFGVGHAVAVALCAWRPHFALALVAALDIACSAVIVPVSSDEPWPWAISSTLSTVVVLVWVGASYPLGRSLLRPAVATAWLAANGGALVVAYARNGDVDWGSVLPAVVLTAVAAVVADLVHSRRRVGGQLVEQQAATASELDARLRAEERARIARELHDVVAHHLSVVVVRADSAPQRVSGLDDAAVAEFRAIGDDARESLEQMRRVLRPLRSGDAEPLNAPQPTLADVAGLVADARAAGVTIEVAGELDGVVGLPGLAAFRTVQEALTNAMRHAPGAPITVRVERDADRLHVHVENPAATVNGSGGHGLRGMRERVAGVGGTVRAEATDHGTFVVHADIPVPAR